MAAGYHIYIYTEVVTVELMVHTVGWQTQYKFVPVRISVCLPWWLCRTSFMIFVEKMEKVQQYIILPFSRRYGASWQYPSPRSYGTRTAYSIYTRYIFSLYFSRALFVEQQLRERRWSVRYFLDLQLTGHCSTTRTCAPPPPASRHNVVL